MASSGSLSSLNSSLIRISGMSSGLDTDSIVKEMLTADQYKVDKQFRTLTTLQWKSDAYRDMNLQVSNFRAANMSVLSPSTNMLSLDAYEIYKISIAGNTNAVELSANSNAVVGQITINSITQLATTASMTSSNAITGAVSLDTALKDVTFATPLKFDTNGQITFNINGKSFTFGQDDTLSNVLSKVNASGAGVTMGFSSLKKGFTITTLGTGASSAITIENVAGNAFSSDEPSAFGIAAGTKNGTDAILSIDGVPVTESTNAFTIDGVSYSLKAKSDTPISFNVERDVDTVYNKIKAFIDNYNSLIDTMQKKIDEEVNRDYPPLTDADREKLSDDQAAKWDDLAKSGIIKDDFNTENLLSNMRSAFYSTITGIGKSAANIGLRTGADYMARGKIIIDEPTLRAAIENNPDEVARIFTNTSSSTDASTKFNESGLVNRLSDAMAQYTKANTTIYLDQNDDAITEAKDRLATLQDWMSTNEEKYYSKFTAMETAMSKLNSQSSWLSQLGS